MKAKYAGQIELSIGFEMEYYPEYFSQMLENVRQMGAEYLILGQHFLQPEHPVVEKFFLIEKVTASFLQPIVVIMRCVEVVKHL